VRPNPVIENAYFDIWVPQAMAGKKAVLEVYNAQGRLVFEAKTGLPGACTQVTWNGRARNNRRVASGKYVAYAKVGGEVLHSAFTLVR
jgi:flagellar hook assembly protein FlgD